MADDDSGYVLKKSVFEKQIRFIQNAFTVVALEEYILLPEEERMRIRNPLALTIDDGYRNFYLHAYPILKHAGLPATVYLPVNFIESGGWMWQDKNKYILRIAKRPYVDFPWDGRVYTLNLLTFQDLLRSMETVYTLCMKVPFVEREKFSIMLADAAGVVLPDKPVEEFKPLTWEEITLMERNRIFFGSHTMNHEILTDVDLECAAKEIQESKRSLEERLGHEVIGFCYPNGNYNEAVIAEVEQCGYKYAVSTENGLNTSGVSIMCMRRVSGPAGGTKRELLKTLYIRPYKELFKSFSKELLWTH